MANWISSKLKAAESILQHIDQQAAESLGKGEGSQSPSDEVLEAIPKKTDQSRPLKYQLPKKSSPPPPPLSPGVGRPVTAPLPSPTVSETSVADGDWTELLSSVEPASSLPPHRGGSRKAAALPSPVARGVRRGPGGVLNDSGGSDVAAKDGTVDNAPGDEDRSKSSGLKPSRRSSSLLNLTKELFKQEFQAGDGDRTRSRGSDVDLEVLDVKDEVDVGDASKSASNGDSRATSIVRSSVSKDELKSTSGSDEESSNSTSTSDSDEEVRQRREERRRKKEQMMAEKMVAIAAAAIRERENIVARLEGEKQSLEKILDEREKKQAQEASELQSSMFHTMEAVEIEKQKHNSTMMEALATLAELETANAELAKSLATAQMNLEREVYLVGELRQQVELKEVALEEHRRKIFKMHESSPSLDEVQSLKRSQIKQEVLDAEYSFVCDKLSKLKDKAKKLEEDVEITRRDIIHPTEVEIELKKRLDQLTDRLIQKQVQVETLSSEKATLVLRIETVSRLLDEDGLSADYAENYGSVGSFEIVDIESGSRQLSSSALRPAIRDKIKTGQRQLGSILRQLDFVFSIGVIYLRRNKKAQVLSLIYLLCLHLWVIYILNSNSHVSESTKSGAVYSLETINKTTGS
ncbi:golgin candidate 2 isoform X1 [Canna indica]|uniref:Golgin candidate 2 isoform X1 n=1 Tax=Canna indica TaxID=4628 RepID=A0AAQ3QP50_9LILI|nr:golgin candidate 2 isoform X1 [Canna indica]